MDEYKREMIQGMAKDAVKSPSVLLTVFSVVLVVLGFLFFTRPTKKPIPTASHQANSTSPEPEAVPVAGLAPPVKKATDGARWVLELAKGQSMYRVRKSLKPPGPPVAVRADIKRKGRQHLSIGLVVTGQAGEYYSGKVLRDGKALPAPRLRIIDRKGRVLFNGTFEYG